MAFEAGGKTWRPAVPVLALGLATEVPCGARKEAAATHQEDCEMELNRKPPKQVTRKRQSPVADAFGFVGHWSGIGGSGDFSGAAGAALPSSVVSELFV